MRLGCVFVLVFLPVLVSARASSNFYLCPTGQSWQSLSISPGSYGAMGFSGSGEELLLNCLAGWVWDYSGSGIPSFRLSLLQDGGVVADITPRLNYTPANSWIRFRGLNPAGHWSLVFENLNTVWNANVHLVFNAFVRTAEVVCQNCPEKGLSGPFCNISCAANCFHCCQNNSSICTICPAGWAITPPKCEFQCKAECLSCDNQAGCIQCADPTRFGPNCDQCPPQPCRQMTTDCTNPCNLYPFCEDCHYALEKLQSWIDIATEVFKDRKAAEVALGSIEFACTVMTPFWAFGCEMGIGLAADGVSFIVTWTFLEAAKFLVAKGACAAMQMCPANVVQNGAIHILP